MNQEATTRTGILESADKRPRNMRADAQRKMISLLQAAMKVFAESGVDPPVREIADAAGVGLGTLYRYFPQRSDLIVAVFQTQVDVCADAASVLAGRYEPGDALAGCNAMWTSSRQREDWLPRFIRATKPISLCRFTSSVVCSLHYKIYSMPRSQLR